VIMGDGPSLYSRFGESAGSTAEDETANNRDGTYGAGITKGTAGAIIGDSNTAITANNSGTGNVTYTSSGWIFTNTGGAVNRTIELWANRTAASDVDALWGTNAGSGGTGLKVLANGDVVLETVTGVQRTWAGAWPGIGQWVHVVLLATEADTVYAPELFINGTSLGALGNIQLSSTNGTFYVGFWSGGGAGEAGNFAFDELAIYEYKLTPAQITKHYQAGAVAVPSAVPVQINAAQTLTKTKTIRKSLGIATTANSARPRLAKKVIGRASLTMQAQPLSYEKAYLHTAVITN
jgi:hypothetical protein